jgi:CO/xanthine dehydrogenase Mo-binding subunit
MEDMRYEDGRVQTNSLAEYKIPCPGDIPEIEIVYVEGAPSPAPFDAKPVGEICTIPTAAAIANAVFDAVGVRIRDLPVTAEKVHEALRRQRRESTIA